LKIYRKVFVEQCKMVLFREYDCKEIQSKEFVSITTKVNIMNKQMKQTNFGFILDFEVKFPNKTLA
jgi:hypothetical protein